jgi:subtilisin family serine protease
VLKIAVVERHLGTGRIGLGFVKGFGLQRGAIATSLAHDAHNIVVVGVDDGDMARAVGRLAETGGGLVVIADRGVQAELPLPVAGILSDAPFEEVVELSDACLAAVRELGCDFPAPFQTLSFSRFSHPEAEDHRPRRHRRRCLRPRRARRRERTGKSRAASCVESARRRGKGHRAGGRVACGGLREWAWGDSTGRGVRVCILDSGVEPNHPLVGPLAGAVAVQRGEDDEITIEPDEEGDLCGHGTACAGIVRSLAPECELHSVRVLGAGYTGSGPILVAGLRYAIENGFDVVNMSLSTTKRDLAESLHELADLAYFQKTMLIASAHNLPVESFPWRFASVLSVGSHDRAEPLDFFYNPEPPVEFFARGVDIDVAWLQGSSLRCTGNSFATPHMTGICALVSEAIRS